MVVKFILTIPTLVIIACCILLYFGVAFNKYVWEDESSQIEICLASTVALMSIISGLIWFLVFLWS